MDRDLARELLHTDPPPAPPPPLSDFTPEVRELRTVAERLGIVAQYLAVLAKHKYVPNVLPRPRTARDEEALIYGALRHQRIAAQLLPNDD